VDETQLKVVGVGQIMVGPAGLGVAMVWLHALVLPHGSVASQVRVATNPPPPVGFVTVLRMVTVTGPQLSLAVGSSKVKVAPPDWLVLLAEQAMVGGVVSAIQV